jgi:hypothetical protein
MKSSVFLDITPCSPLKYNRRFGKTCRFHLQSWRVNQARNQHEIFGLLFWRRRRHIPPKRQLTYNGLHGVISQEAELFELHYFANCHFMTVARIQQIGPKKKGARIPQIILSTDEENSCSHHSNCSNQSNFSEDFTFSSVKYIAAPIQHAQVQRNSWGNWMYGGW